MVLRGTAPTPNDCTDGRGCAAPERARCRSSSYNAGRYLGGATSIVDPRHAASDATTEEGEDEEDEADIVFLLDIDEGDDTLDS